MIAAARSADCEHGCVGVRARDRWHDRRVRHSQAVDPADAQFEVGDGSLVDAEPARADGVVVGAGAAAQVVALLRCRAYGRARARLLLSPPGERRRGADLAAETQRREHRLHVALVGQEGGVDHGAASGSFDASVTEPRLCGRSALNAIV
jgi:hypothetical protein